MNVSSLAPQPAHTSVSSAFTPQPTNAVHSKEAPQKPVLSANSSTVASELVTEISPIDLLSRRLHLLQRFVTLYPDFVTGDDMATCSTCIQTVLVSAVILGTRSPDVISYVTSYPTLYIAAIFNVFDKAQVGTTEMWREKAHASIEKLEDTTALHDWLNNLMYEEVDFWEHFYEPQTQVYLTSLRGAALFGGRQQNWVDADALDYFDLD